MCSETLTTARAWISIAADDTKMVDSITTFCGMYFASQHIFQLMGIDCDCGRRHADGIVVRSLLGTYLVAVFVLYAFLSTNINFVHFSKGVFEYPSFLWWSRPSPMRVGDERFYSRCYKINWVFNTQWGITKFEPVNKS